MNNHVQGDNFPLSPAFLLPGTIRNDFEVKQFPFEKIPGKSIGNRKFSGETVNFEGFGVYETTNRT